MFLRLKKLFRLIKGFTIRAAIFRCACPMLTNFWTDLLPFRVHLEAATLASVCLWALALYLGFSPVSEWVTEQFTRWFNYAERSLYFSADEFERSRRERESVNLLFASLFSIVPFLVVGGVCNYGIEVGLGHSWALSMGILACVGGGVYELGRRDGQNSQD